MCGAADTRFRANPNRRLALPGKLDGAAIDELQTATGWQAHSVRGFLAGTVKKKLGLVLQSNKAEDGVRRYRVAQAGA